MQERLLQHFGKFVSEKVEEAEAAAETEGGFGVARQTDF